MLEWVNECFFLMNIIYKVIKQLGTLCLVDRTSVVILSLALNPISVESLFILLPSHVPYVGIVHLWDEQHNTQVGELPRKMCQVPLPLKNRLFICWYAISAITGKTRLLTVERHLNAVTYQDETLKPVAIPNLHNPGPKPILRDGSARPHGARTITEWPANRPDLNPAKHSRDQFGCPVRARADQHSHVG